MPKNIRKTEEPEVILSPRVARKRIEDLKEARELARLDFE